MVKFFLIVAAIVFILVLSSSPAQIEYLLESGTPFYTLLWMSPLAAAIVIYMSFRRTNIEDDFKIRMEGTKGGEAIHEVEEIPEEDEEKVFNEDGSRQYLTRIKDEE
jgi:hypothetical protein